MAGLNRKAPDYLSRPTKLQNLGKIRFFHQKVDQNRGSDLCRNSGTSGDGRCHRARSNSRWECR